MGRGCAAETCTCRFATIMLADAMTDFDVRSRISRSISGLGVALLLVGTVACAMNPERLPELDRRFYYNLDSSTDQEEFLRLRDEERQAYLDRKGLWKKWIALPHDGVPRRRPATSGRLPRVAGSWRGDHPRYRTRNPHGTA